MQQMVSRANVPQTMVSATQLTAPEQSELEWESLWERIGASSEWESLWERIGTSVYKIQQEQEAKLDKILRLLQDPCSTMEARNASSSGCKSHLDFPKFSDNLDFQKSIDVDRAIVDEDLMEQPSSGRYEEIDTGLKIGVEDCARVSKEVEDIQFLDVTVTPLQKTKEIEIFMPLPHNEKSTEVKKRRELEQDKHKGTERLSHVRQNAPTSELTVGLPISTCYSLSLSWLLNWFPRPMVKMKFMAQHGEEMDKEGKVQWVLAKARKDRIYVVVLEVLGWLCDGEYDAYALSKLQELTMIGVLWCDRDTQSSLVRMEEWENDKYEMKLGIAKDSVDNLSIHWKTLPNLRDDLRELVELKEENDVFKACDLVDVSLFHLVKEDLNSCEREIGNSKSSSMHFDVDVKKSFDVNPASGCLFLSTKPTVKMKLMDVPVDSCKVLKSGGMTRGTHMHTQLGEVIGKDLPKVPRGTFTDKRVGAYEIADDRKGLNSPPMCICPIYEIKLVDHSIIASGQAHHDDSNNKKWLDGSFKGCPWAIAADEVVVQAVVKLEEFVSCAKSLSSLEWLLL